MRLLVINPNTSQFVTDIVAAEARRAAGAGTEIVPVTGEAGAPIVGCRTEDVIAAGQVIELAARRHDEADAVLLAISFDSGVRAARELLPIPVVGMCEAAAHLACMLGGKFALLTFGDRAGAIYEEIIEGYGLASRFTGVFTLPILSPEELHDTSLVAGRVLEAVHDAADRGAESVVLAGAVFAGLPSHLRDRTPIPLVDGIAAGVRMAEALVALGTSPPARGSYRRPEGKDLANVGEGLTACYRTLQPLPPTEKGT